MSVTPELVEQWLGFLIANAVNDALTLGLSDDLGGKVVHLNSNIPRDLNLSIANTLTARVQIVGQPGPASSSNYHFHIQFVNNQCLLGAPTLTTPKWAMTPNIDNNGFVTDIYLLRTETITLDAAPAAGGTTSVQLQYTGAMLSNPAVEVLQVSVTVGQNVYALLQPNPQPVTGTETIHLTSFTDAGAPSPLIATLVQPKTILNDGTPRDLLLRLVNTSPEPVTFTPPADAGSKTPTAIQLSVDLNDTAWALCKSDEVGSIAVTPPRDWHEEPAGKTGAGQKTWLFRPDYTKTKRIEPNAALEFPIKGVKTTLPPGFTNLYVTLQEFLNYGTQTVVTQIEKSPLIYNKDLNSGLLSQGTTGANQALTLKGNTAGDLMLVEQSGGGGSAHFKGGAGVTIEKNLDVVGNARIAKLVGSDDTRLEKNLLVLGDTRLEKNLLVLGDTRLEKNLLVLGDTRISDHTLWLRQGADTNHGIGWYGSGRPFAKASIDGAVAFGYEGGALGSTDGGERIALRWNRFGNVGIGTTEPASALSVKGGVAIGSYAETTTAPQSGMIVEGNVGIGTSNPTKAKLQVSGNQLTDTGIFAFLAYRASLGAPFIAEAGPGQVNNSIWADNRIAGVEFNAFSDARMKNVLGRSDGTQDLATLMRVEVTDYTYKDTVTRGNRLQKKVVGQQLLGVYDQAVSSSTDVVPDIFQGAESSDGWIDLNTTLQAGDRVKVIPENGSEAIVEVTDVEPNRFRVTPGFSDGAVFVFGREVNDFLSVDYDAIAMLNVSATQQIKREKDAEVQALRQENAELRARLEQLEKLMESQKKAQSA